MSKKKEGFGQHSINIPDSKKQDNMKIIIDTWRKHKREWKREDWKQ